ncbi:hypothetical protein [Cupriavidus sp. TMH.W2]|uniref:hypothetical protein n=1 Tax=Cupriavidus sp. TMH.W2 TaxID=3434465 RepID=UPI003D77545B
MSVVLVAALTQFVAMSDTMGLRNQSYADAGSQVAIQANLIRARILLCGSDYPDGNNGTPYRPALPGGSVALFVSTLVCPGTAQNLWTGTDGVTYPPTPKFMTRNWQYVNDATSARLMIVGDGNALAQAATRLGTDATVSGSILTFKVSN